MVVLGKLGESLAVPKAEAMRGSLTESDITLEEFGCWGFENVDGVSFMAPLSGREEILRFLSWPSSSTTADREGSSGECNGDSFGRSEASNSGFT
jgi:hypothetical protein